MERFLKRVSLNDYIPHKKSEEAHAYFQTIIETLVMFQKDQSNTLGG